MTFAQPRRRSWLIPASCLALFALLGLAIWLHGEPYFPLDVTVSRLVQSLPRPGFESLTRGISHADNNAIQGAIIDNSVKLSTAEKKLLDLTNAERKKRDLPPLTPSPLLFKVARAHAQNMARLGKLEHVLDGKNPVERLRDAGYRVAAMAENIAWIDERIPLETIMKDWMGSQIHRDNILGKDMTEIGLGLARNSKGQIYCAQEFGKPR